MQCKFVVGQKVVCIETEAKRTLEVGKVYTISLIALGVYEPDGSAEIGVGLKEIGGVNEWAPGYPRLFRYRYFRPVHDLGFWIGQEAAEKLKSGRGLEIPKHTDDGRRDKVRLP